MGYFCGFLLLLVPPADVAKILHRVGTDSKYTPGFARALPSLLLLLLRVSGLGLEI